MFVAVGHDGLRLTSDDGKDWKPAQAGKEGEVYRAVAFGNGVFADGRQLRRPEHHGGDEGRRDVVDGLQRREVLALYPARP